MNCECHFKVSNSVERVVRLRSGSSLVLRSAEVHVVRQIDGHDGLVTLSHIFTVFREGIVVWLYTDYCYSDKPQFVSSSRPKMSKS